MKKLGLIFTVLFMLISAVSAEDKFVDDKSCRQVYNTAFNNLRNHMLDYNDEVIGTATFASFIVGIDAHLKSKRAICYIFETEKNKKCVEAYKKRYDALRREMKITAILFGEQAYIEENILEMIKNEFSVLYSKLKCGDLIEV